MRVCFKVRDFPDPIVKEFDSLVYNQVTNEARFYNYGNQGKDGSLYISFKSTNTNLDMDYWSLSYEALKMVVLETGFIDLTDDIIYLMDNKHDVVARILNDAKIDSRSINMRFVEEH